MWKAKLRIKHDCIFDERCKKYCVQASVISFNPFKKGRWYYCYHLGSILGDAAHTFLQDIQNDPRVDYIETEGNTFMIVEKRSKRETPGEFYTNELIYVKPVIVDTDGWETWVLASIRKETITTFAASIPECRIISIGKCKLQDIHFPRLSPHLSTQQRKSINLAMAEGYYDVPKNINLDHLAELSKVSRGTFREHLRKAEKKILGEFTE